MALAWARALAWRLQRQMLDPVGAGSVADVVETLGAVPAWPEASAELVIGARRVVGLNGDAARALLDRTLINVYAFRGATHLMTPSAAGAYLAVRASSRMWELPSWQSFYGLAPEDWSPFRDFVLMALAEAPVTRSELIAALRRSSRYRHLSSILDKGNDTLLKPLTWQGVMTLGPVRDGEATFLPLNDVPGWTGLRDLAGAGLRVVSDYLRSYGPAPAEQLYRWFGEGLGAKRRDIAGWLDRLEGRLERIIIEGEPVLVLREDLEDLHAATSSDAVRFLPGRDPWVMAPGTSDVHVVPPQHREAVSRSANLVVSRGRVAGTWRLRGERLGVTWFKESGRVPRTALDRESDALANFLDRPLDVETTIA